MVWQSQATNMLPELPLLLCPYGLRSTRWPGLRQDHGTAHSKLCHPPLDRVGQFQRWARRATGLVFILLGIYYCLVYIFGVFEIT